MNTEENPRLLDNFHYFDQHPTLADFRQVVLSGFRSKPKRLPPWLLYDLRGSQLFDQIVEHADYYPPDAEREIFKSFGSEIAKEVGDDTLVIEPGAGSCNKVRWLIEAGFSIKRYLPIEISSEILKENASKLAGQHPGLEVFALATDYLRQIQWPTGVWENVRRTIVFFPGTSIGNYEPQEAQSLLDYFRHWIPGDGGLLIGVDNPKDAAIMERAYDDRDGLSAEFNLNLLDRIASAFEQPSLRSEFEHHSVYNAASQRMEMHLKAKRKFRMRLGEEVFRFEAGETIHTENSYKYGPDQFTSLALQAAFGEPRIWSDSRSYFYVYYFPAA